MVRSLTPPWPQDAPPFGSLQQNSGTMRGTEMGKGAEAVASGDRVDRAIAVANEGSGYRTEHFCILTGELVRQ